MAEPLCLAEVRLWDRTVGAVAELDDGRAIVQEVGDALARWDDLARAAGVPKDRIRRIGDAFRLHCVPPSR